MLCSNVSTGTALLAGLSVFPALLYGQAPALDPVNELQLDLTPMQQPSSSFLSLQSEGRAELFRYSRNRLTVSAHRAGKLSQQETASLVARAQSGEALQALERGNFTGEGLTRGDQVLLTVRHRSGRVRALNGFVDDTPEPMRALIRDLVSAGERLDKELPLEEAYLRSRTVMPDRVRSLRSSGKIRIVLLHELPSDIQNVVRSSIQHPQEFTGTSKSSFDRLVPWCSHGHEFFVDHQGNVHQISLFQSEPAA